MLFVRKEISGDDTQLAGIEGLNLSVSTCMAARGAPMPPVNRDTLTSEQYSLEEALTGKSS